MASTKGDGEHEHDGCGRRRDAACLNRQVDELDRLGHSPRVAEFSFGTEELWDQRKESETRQTRGREIGCVR